MNRLLAIVGTTVVAGLLGWAPPAQAQPETARAASDGSARLSAFATTGSIEGTVSDERGAPLSGVMVSAIGATSAVAITDKRGVFVFASLPPGSYVLRAHLAGFLVSRRQSVEVRASSPSRQLITLERAASAKASPPPGAQGQRPTLPPPPPKVMAAGLAPVETTFDPLALDPFGIAAGVLKKNSDDASETAWRIRHLPRSVLKDTTDRASNAPGGNAGPPGSERKPAAGSGLSRAFGAPVKALGDLPLTGQVNLMTSASFDGGQASSSESAMRGSAFFSLAGPAWGYGDWSARVLTQATPGSWFLSGGFSNRAPSKNLYHVGFAYSSQRLAPAVTAPLTLERTEPGDHTAGLFYGAGRFTVSPRLVIDYSGQYAWYDYMRGGGLLSPGVVVTLAPYRRFRIRAGVSERQVAPGAEEFLEPFAAGMWLPPEHTFVAFSPMVPERTIQYDLSLEHDIADGLTVALRSFYQDTAHQQMLIFGDAMAQQPGHYGVADVGSVLTRGWSVGISHHLLPRVSGSVAYELTEATWWPTASGQELLVLGFSPRSGHEQLHGLATSVDADLPVTDTHVFVAYRLNSGFIKPEGDGSGTGFDSRFDVQVTQRLPFLNFTTAQWQVLFVVKNVFRDVARDSSFYDELLVVKPPTRILGGFIVRF
jgi:hypothetical protein